MPPSIRALFGGFIAISWISVAGSFPLTSRPKVDITCQMTAAEGSAAMKVRRHVSPFVTSSGGNSDNETTSCLIILNRPMNRPPSRIFQHLWDRSNYRICADGGANRLFDATTASSELKEKSAPGAYLPDKIKGDLDSLRPNVRVHYEKLGVDVERDTCQDTNDLDKCLQTILARRSATSSEAADDDDKKTNVYIYGAFGGRFDQEMASIQALYRWADAFSYRLTLYSDDTCAFLLPAGVMNEVTLANIIETDENESEVANQQLGEGVTCGLVPIGCRCDSVTTTGLKWNLDGDVPLEFGGLVSTSNRIVEDTVTVKSSQPLVFTTEMRY